MSHPTRSPGFDPPARASTTRIAVRTVLIVVAAALAVAGLVAAVVGPLGANHAAGGDAPFEESLVGNLDVGDTSGYSITNESGSPLVYQRVAGHVGAPPLPVGGAWLPGQTLNFEVGANETGDALFEAYTVDGTDAGTVDLHFNSLPSRNIGEALAYLNPLDTAPLQASAEGLTPIQTDGATWTMQSGLKNKITSDTPSTYAIDSAWTFNGVTASQLFTSVTTAPDSTCSGSGSTVMSCTLGGVTWTFSGSS